MARLSRLSKSPMLAKAKGKISKGAALAKFKWDEAKHKRDQMTGRFLHKPGSEEFKAETYGPGKTKSLKDSDIIKLHVTENPKKPGSMAATDFAQYKNNMTVGEFKAAMAQKGGVGAKAHEHLGYDLKKGFITVHDPAQLAQRPGAGLAKPPMPAVAQTLPKPADTLPGGAGAQPGAPAPKPQVPGQVAPAPAPAPAAPAPAAAPAPSALKQSDYLITSKIKGVKENDIIKLHAPDNPKKPGSKANADFAKYKDGMTVGEFHAAVGDKVAGQNHIMYDLKKGFITVHHPADLAAMKAGTLTPGTLAAHMQSNDKQLGVITKNPFQPGQNHDDFEATAKQMGLTTAKSQEGLGAPAAAAKTKTMADLADDDVVVSVAGSEFTGAEVKEYVQAGTVTVQEVDEALANGDWKLKTGAAPAAPAKSAIKFKDDDVVETWLGNKYTVADYKIKEGIDDADADKILNEQIDDDLLQFVPKAAPPPKVAPPAPAPKPAPAPEPPTPAPKPAPEPKPAPSVSAPAPAAAVTQYADDDIVTSKFGNSGTVAAWKKSYGPGADEALDKYIKSGALTHTPAPAPAPAPAPVKKTPGGLADDAVIAVGGGQYTVSEFKVGLKKQLFNPNDKNIDEYVDKLVAGGTATIVKMGSSSAPQTAATVPKVITKLADIPEADYAKWDVTVTKPSNPYKDGTNEFKKFFNIEKTTGGSKTKTIEKYFQSTTLTKEEQKAALQQMVDDGHVKFVSPEQKVAVEAQKAKFAQQQAAEAQQKAAAASAANANKHKLHYEQIKPADWKDNTTRWGKAAGLTSLSAPNKKEVMEQTRKAVGLPFNSRNIPAVASYTASGYDEINSTLRKKGYDALSPSRKTHVQSLDGLMSATKEDAIMWRGIGTGGAVDNFNNLPPPLEFPDMGYASMSHNPNVSLSTFAGYSGITGNRVLFRVRVPKGTNAAFISRRYTETEAMADEAEVIAARGTRFKYVSTTENMTVGGYSKIDVIDVEIVTNAGGNS